MPIRVFSQEEKESLRIQMLKAGLPLLKEYGMTHMSVNKITAAANIGKSTFYNFFSSKEEYVNEVIKYNRSKFMEQIKDILNGREKMTSQEGKEMLKKIIFSEDSVYQYLTGEEERSLFNASSKEEKVNLEKETKIIDYLAQIIEGVKKDLDYAVISNLMKIMAMALAQRDMLHEEGYIRTQERIFELLFECIFEEE